MSGSVELYITGIVTIIILLLFSAIFSSAETVITAVSSPLLDRLSKRGSSKRQRRIKKTLHLLGEKERTIATLLIANNLTNILASSIATAILVGTYGGEKGVALATIIMTLFIVFAGEILPKTYALKHTLRLYMLLALPLHILVYIFSPLTRIVMKFNFVAKGWKKEELQKDQEELDEELRGVIDQKVDEDTESQQEKIMLHSILDLDEVDVWGVMRHRKDVMIVDLAANKQDNIDKILSSQHSYIPLYKESTDNITHIIEIKSFMLSLLKYGREGIELGSMGEKANFVMGNVSLLEQLIKFRGENKKCAIVVDEYGSFAGLLTIHDIIEEIVGPLDKEKSLSDGDIVIDNELNVVVHGSTTIRQINRELDWHIEDEYAETIAGYLIHHVRIVPEKGSSYEIRGLRYSVLERQKNQVTLIKIEVLDSMSRSELGVRRKKSSNKKGKKNERQ